MARLRRRWRVVKWGGSALTLLIAFAGSMSMLGSCGYYGRTGALYPGSGLGPQVRVVAVGAGSVYYQSHPDNDFYGIPSDEIPRGWVADRLELRTILPHIRWWPSHTPGWASRDLIVPLWIPFLLLALPTAFLVWLDRRRIPPHCCQCCGYDLTGNTRGVCPECGGKA